MQSNPKDICILETLLDTIEVACAQVVLSEQIRALS